VRRDFIGTALVGSGAILLGAKSPASAQNLTGEWTGYGGTGDHARSNGNTAEVVNAAHGVRDGRYEAAISSAPLVDDRYDLVIVGGGFAGIIAAYEFRKAAPASTLPGPRQPPRVRRRSEAEPDRRRRRDPHRSAGLERCGDSAAGQLVSARVGLWD